MSGYRKQSIINQRRLGVRAEADSRRSSSHSLSHDLDEPKLHSSAFTRQRRLVSAVLLLIITAIGSSYLLQSGHNASYTEPEGSPTVCRDEPQSCAYVTMLCDDEMLSATEVLLYSLQLQHSLHPVEIMVLPNVSESARARLRSTTAKVTQVDQLDYPFKGLKVELGVNRQCRYTKLRAFGMVQYRKLIYLDADTLVRKNIDHIFNVSCDVGAALDLDGSFNTGVLLLKPSAKIYGDMLSKYMITSSYNLGDQGFLNAYLPQATGLSVVTLPRSVNVASQRQRYALGRNDISDASLYHFSGDTKPWNFFKPRRAGGGYHASMFSAWRLALSHARLQSSAATDNPAMQPQLHATVDHHISACEAYSSDAEDNDAFPIRNQTTIVFTFTASADLEHLDTALRYYLRSERVHKIVLYLPHDTTQPLQTIQDLIDIGDVEPLYQDASISKFSLLPGLSTQSVCFLDMSSSLSLSDLAFGFSVWRRRQEGLVGFYTANADLDANSDLTRSYSILSDRALLMHSSYLHAYTCALPTEIHAFVQEHTHSAALALNKMVAAMSGKPPLLVASEYDVDNSLTLVDFGTQSELLQLTDLFGGETLLENDEMVYAFRQSSNSDIANEI